MLEKVTREIIDGLQKIGTDEAINCAQKGIEALEGWLDAPADTQKRRDASISITIFQKEAIIIIMKWRQEA